jgi:hypothetical protein
MPPRKKSLIQVAEPKAFVSYGQSLNLIDSEKQPLKIAVLELSSRAVKAMVGNFYYLLSGFKWGKPAFINQARLTHTEQYLDTQQNLNVQDFRYKVLPEIKKLKQFCEDQKASRIICVATAVYRNAVNFEEILKLIKSECKLDVQIIDREAEAMATFQGYLWASKQQLDQNLVLIDQGGGSTEITLFSNTQKKVKSANINLGTENILSQFKQHVASQTKVDFEMLLHQHIEALGEIVHKNLKALIQTIQKKEMSFEIVGVGTSITNATQLSSNEQQHGTILALDQLNQKAQKLETLILAQSSQMQEISEYLVDYFGLKMFILILQALNQNQIKVNGASLRYGIFKQEMDSIYPPKILVKESSAILNYLTKLLPSIENFKESGEYDGFVIAHLEQGMQIALSPKVIGLAPYPKGKRADHFPFKSKVKVVLTYIGFDYRKNLNTIDLDLIL